MSATPPNLFKNLNIQDLQLKVTSVMKTLESMVGAAKTDVSAAITKGDQIAKSYHSGRVNALVTAMEIIWKSMKG